MNLLTRNARKLYMAAASKGKYQHVCDCSLYEKWDGFSDNPRNQTYSLIVDENLENDESHVGNRILEAPVKIEDDSFFNKIYFTYKNNTPDLKSFVVKYLCLVGHDGVCLPVDPHSVTAIRYSDGHFSDHDELNLKTSDIGQLFKTGEAKFGFDNIFKHGARYEISLNNKVRYRDISKVVWNYFSDDCCGTKELSVGSDINLYRDGEVVVHMGNLWAAYGDINDTDDEPSKSIHWEFLCSCERDLWRVETPTPTPTPTLTPTPTATPTPTPTFEDIVCWCDDHAPWYPSNYDWKSVVSHKGYLYQAHDYQGTEAMDEPGMSHHWFQLCRCIELCYPPEICVRVEESLGWQIVLEHTGSTCMGRTGHVEFTEETGIPTFTDQNRFINAIRFSYEGTSEKPVYFNTKYFAMMRNDDVIGIDDYVLIDPFGNEVQHAYCAGDKNVIGSHGLSGSPESIFIDDDDNWGVPITSCGGYFTLFFKTPMDISAVNKVVWKYSMGDECGKRTISFRNVEMNPLTNGTYQLADPLQEWKVIETIRDATDYRLAGYLQKFGKNRICPNKPKLGGRKPINSKMPLTAYDIGDFNNLSTKVILAMELDSQTKECGSQYDNIVPTHGDNATRKSVNGLTVKFFQEGGKLCYDNLDLESPMAGQAAQYGVKLEIGEDEVLGLINTVAPFTNNELMYIAPDGKFYRGTLETQDGFDNIFSFAGTCEEVVPEGDPTPTPTPTRTSFVNPDPVISLESENINIQQRIWTDSSFPTYHASISGEAQPHQLECESGVSLPGQGGYITFPTYKRNMPIVSFGVIFEINGSPSVTGESDQDSQFIVFQQSNRTDEYEGFYLSYEKQTGSRGRVTIGVKSISGNEYTLSSPDESVVWNQRYHVHAVFDETQMKLYVDGEFVGATEKPEGINYHPTHKMHVGRARPIGTENDSFMNGVIYGFSFYEDILSNQYVKELFEKETCPPTPSPTPTASPTPTPTVTQVLDDDCIDHMDDRTWTILNSNFTAYGSSCIIESVWENEEHESWQVVIEEGNCGEIECCREWLNQYEVGPEIDTIVDGENQITIGKQLYEGTICVDAGRGDVENLLINEVTLYIEGDKALGTIIFMGNVKEHTTVYFSISNSDNAERYGYPYLTDKCVRGRIENGECLLKEYG